MARGPLFDYVRTQLIEALGDDGPAAADLLANTEFPLVTPGSGVDRQIHCAILKRVTEPWRDRDKQPTPLQKFNVSLEIAKTDWRDIVMYAHLARMDWRKVMARAGFELPPRPWWQFWP